MGEWTVLDFSKQKMYACAGSYLRRITNLWRTPSTDVPHLSKTSKFTRRLESAEGRINDDRHWRDLNRLLDSLSNVQSEKLYWNLKKCFESGRARFVENSFNNADDCDEGVEVIAHSFLLQGKG